MATTPEVSILMPVHNEINHIDTAILSVLAENNIDWELLVCDDNSDDGTYERVLFWASIDERIRAMCPHSEPGHFIDNCNIMLNEATGTYIARLDGDDITLPNRLTLQVEFLKKNEQASYIGGLALALIQKDGTLTTDYPYIRDMVTPFASKETPVNKVLKYINPVVHSTAMGRREVMLTIGGYDHIPPSEDWDMALMLSEQGDVYVLPEVFAIKRQHETNLTIISKDSLVAEEAYDRLREKHNLPFEKRIRMREVASTLAGLRLV